MSNSKVLELLNTAYRILNMDEGDEYRYNVAIPLKEAIIELNRSMTCEGCKYNIFGCGSDGIAVDCDIGMNCSRAIPDNYEPRELL